MDNLFRIAGDTVNASATTTSGTSSRTALPGVTGGSRLRQVRVYSTEEAFIRFGDANVAAATATSCPLPADVPVGFSVTENETHFAVITATGTATVYVTPGNGL